MSLYRLLGWVCKLRYQKKGCELDGRLGIHKKALNVVDSHLSLAIVCLDQGTRKSWHPPLICATALNPLSNHACLRCFCCTLYCIQILKLVTELGRHIDEVQVPCGCVVALWLHLQQCLHLPRALRGAKAASDCHHHDIASLSGIFTGRHL